MRELSLNVLDVAQNSVAANAKNIEIEALTDTAANTLLLSTVFCVVTLPLIVFILVG